MTGEGRRITVIVVSVMLTVSILGAAADSKAVFRQAESYTVRIYGSTITAIEGASRSSWGGSGFIVDIDRKAGVAYIATNKHVIGTGISSLQISFKDGERLTATPIYIDPVYDFGMLEFNLNEPGVPDNISVARLGNSTSIEVGHPVGTFGNPEGFEYCGTEGIISSVTNNPGCSGSFLQTDAAINHGNSGGPLISLETGAVIAINTAISRTEGSVVEGIGWSLAIDQLKPIMNQVIEDKLPYAGQMGWLGISLDEINVDRAEQDFGAVYNDVPRKALLVRSINVGSPAEKAGISPGDVILSVDGKTPEDYPGFQLMMRELGGKDCSIKTCRFGEIKTINATPTDLGALRPREYVSFAGMTIQSGTPNVLDGSIEPDCVYVSDKLEGSSAEAWGAYIWPVRGILVNLKYYPTKSLDDFWNAIKDVQQGQSVELFYGPKNNGYVVKVVYYYDSEAPKRVAVEQ
jgi:S1-C subfamily serine protease